jgi:gas vesicle protein
MRPIPVPWHMGCSFGVLEDLMEDLYSPATAGQANKTAKDAQKLGSDVRKDFDDAVARGKNAVKGMADDLKSDLNDSGWSAAERARDVADAARRNLGKAADKVTAYADENTALVAMAAFGVGLLVGHLVSRES